MVYIRPIQIGSYQYGTDGFKNLGSKTIGSLFLKSVEEEIWVSPLSPRYPFRFKPTHLVGIYSSPQSFSASEIQDGY